VYLSARKSMTVRFFIHSIAKRAKAITLVDSGATENFMNLSYAKWLRLPIKQMDKPKKLLNINGTENKSGELKYYTDLAVQTGSTHTTLQFYLLDLGDQKAILGYPWFAAVQPNIDWRKGWIDHTQLPIVFWTNNAKRARFVPRQRNIPRTKGPSTYFIGKVLLHPQAIPAKPIPRVPAEFARHRKVFSEEDSQRLPKHTIWDHAIELLPGAPSSLPRQLLPLKQDEIAEAHKFVAEHLKRGTICESWSPYAANFFFVKKKDGKLCPVQDYRPVNKWTKWNRNVSPLIPQTIDRLSGCTLFTKFDIRWGYNNIRIKPGDEWKAAFLTPEGLFEPTVMFFGLINSPATFQMMMNTIFRKQMAQGWLSVYMDNIAIHTWRRPGETEEEHRKRHQVYIHLVLEILEQYDLYLKPEKCTFEQKEIDYLGVIVGEGTLRMDPKKIQGIADWSPPTTVTEVRQFLGFTGYYRYFVPNYSKIARPLLDLTKKTFNWHWGPEQMRAFETLKTLMCHKPVLAQPNFDKRFYLQIDASAYGVGTILSQVAGPNPSTDNPDIDLPHKIPNRNPTRSPTTPPPSPQRKGITISTSESCWPLWSR
jgi:reverse transcriptase-like protein